MIIKNVTRRTSSTITKLAEVHEILCKELFNKEETNKEGLHEAINKIGDAIELQIEMLMQDNYKEGD